MTKGLLLPLLIHARALADFMSGKTERCFVLKVEEHAARHKLAAYNHLIYSKFLQYLVMFCLPKFYDHLDQPTDIIFKLT